MIDYLVTQIFLGFLVLLTFFGLRSAPPLARLVSCLVGLALWCFPVHLIRLPVRSMEPIAASKAWLVDAVGRGVSSEGVASGFSSHDAALFLMVGVFLLGFFWFLSDIKRAAVLVRALERRGVALAIDPERFDFLTRSPVRIRMIRGEFDACVTGVFRPTIWVGQRHLHSDHFPSLLFHEWVHLKNGDGFWHVAIHLLQRLFWWNPLSQFFAYQAKAYLELRCDETCGKSLSPEVYGSHLAQALLVRSGLKPTNQLALGYTRSKNLDIKRIIYLRRSFQMKSLHVLLILMVAMVGLGVTAGRPFLIAEEKESTGISSVAHGAPAQERETSTKGRVYKLDEEGVSKPEFTKKVEPIFPEEAKKKRLKAKVIIEAIAGADGEWKDIHVIKVVGDENAGFQQAATDAVAQWEFKPATVDGKPVNVAITLNIQFSLK